MHFYGSWELEAAILSAKEEIERREVELIHVKDALNKTIKERNEAQTQCQKLLLEQHFLQQQLQKQQPITNSIKSELPLNLAVKRPLPKKGKLLKAVIEAGPLLQNLLLAGPLPQWQHPPPQLDFIEIPPVALSISSSPSPRFGRHNGAVMNPTADFSRKKRGLEFSELGFDSAPKYQKVVPIN